MIKRYLLAVSLLLGVTWDFLYWEKTPGISYPIFIIICLAAGFVLLRSGSHHPSRINYLLFGLIVLFSTLTFLRKEFFTRFGDFAVSFLIILLLSGTYKSGAWVYSNLFDYLNKFFHFLGQLIVLPWISFIPEKKNPDEERFDIRSSVVWKIMRGLLLSIPILIVFLILLASADLIFAQKLEDILQYFSILDLTEHFFRGLLVLIIAYFFIGLIRYAEIHSQRTQPVVREKPIISPILGFTEGATILLSVIVLFSVFVIIQFRYFFSGTMNITTYGFTYSEYARRGFGELVMVAVFSLILIQGIRIATNLNTPKQLSIFIGLVLVMVLMNLVILTSSFQRLLLYESAYGFSSLRTYAHVFIIWLGVLLISVIILELIQKPTFFTNATLMACVGFVFTLNLINVDSFIVQQNLKRADRGLDLDTQYLVSLSSDAIPQLVKEYISSEHSPKIRHEVGAVLACQNQLMKISEGDPQKNPWQSFHFSNWYAVEMIKKIEKDLGRYPVSDDDYGYRVYGPEGIEIFCPDPGSID